MRLFKGGSKIDFHNKIVKTKHGSVSYTVKKHVSLVPKRRNDVQDSLNALRAPRGLPSLQPVNQNTLFLYWRTLEGPLLGDFLEILGDLPGSPEGSPGGSD